MVKASGDVLKCELNAKIPLTHVEAALTAVIRTQQGSHYFSLKHAGTQPDFHLRDSFVLKVNH
jgi:hypothetical protein